MCQPGDKCPWEFKINKCILMVVEWRNVGKTFLNQRRWYLAMLLQLHQLRFDRPLVLFSPFYVSVPMFPLRWYILVQWTIHLKIPLHSSVFLWFIIVQVISAKSAIIQGFLFCPQIGEDFRYPSGKLTRYPLSKAFRRKWSFSPGGYVSYMDSIHLSGSPIHHV